MKQSAYFIYISSLTNHNNIVFLTIMKTVTVFFVSILRKLDYVYIANWTMYLKNLIPWDSLMLCPK